MHEKFYKRLVLGTGSMKEELLSSNAETMIMYTVLCLAQIYTLSIFYMHLLFLLKFFIRRKHLSQYRMSAMTGTLMMRSNPLVRGIRGLVVIHTHNPHPCPDVVNYTDEPWSDLSTTCTLTGHDLSHHSQLSE